MNILLAPVGSHGDVHPFIAMGRLLQRRGHTITMITSEPFRDLAEKHGFHFAPTGTAEDYHALTHDPDLWHPSKSLGVLFSGERPERLLREAFWQIEKHYEPGNTMLLAGSLGLAARIAHEKLGIPFLSVHLQPAAMMSITDPPVFATARIPKWMPLWMRRLLYWYAEKYVADPLIAPAVNRLRVDLGLTKITRIYGAWRHSPLGILALYPQWYGSAADDPARLRHVGFLQYDQEEQPMPEPVQQFLDAGLPPLVVSFGSAMRQGRPYFEAALAAAKQLGLRVLLLAKSGEQIPPNLPATVCHADYVPFSQVLPRAAAILHHGGIGTAAQALRAAVPQFIMPMAFDQPDNAERLTRLGVALSLPATKFTVENLLPLLRELVTNESFPKHARAHQQNFAQEPDPNQAFLAAFDEFVLMAKEAVERKTQASNSIRA